jgi:hypothetical protein
MAGGASCRQTCGIGSSAPHGRTSRCRCPVKFLRPQLAVHDCGDVAEELVKPCPLGEFELPEAGTVLELLGGAPVERNPGVPQEARPPVYNSSMAFLSFAPVGLLGVSAGIHGPSPQFVRGWWCCSGGAGGLAPRRVWTSPPVNRVFARSRGSVFQPNRWVGRPRWPGITKEIPGRSEVR